MSSEPQKNRGCRGLRVCEQATLNERGLHKAEDHGTPALSRKRRRHRGAVLVLVMWMLIVLGLLLLSLNRGAQVSVALAGNRVEAVQARWLARAGVEKAMAVLAADDPATDGTADLWYDNPAEFENIALAEGYTYRVTAPPPETAEGNAVRFGVEDEASRLNLNTANFRQLTYTNLLTDLQADAILDWIDTNERSRPGGAERGHYSQLDIPYLIANTAMRTHREALLVKGIEPADFFGEDANANGLLERSENDGETTYPPDDADGVLRRGLMGLTTVFTYDLNTNPLGTQRIDMREPDASVLVSSFNMTQALADAVVEKGRERPDSLFDFVGVRGASGGDNGDGGDGRGGSNNNSGGSGNSSSASTGDAASGGDAINEVTVDTLAQYWEYLSLTDDERLRGKLNLNTATRAALETIPRVDPAVADAIVQYRQTNGDITNVGSLLSMGVVNRRDFERVAPYVAVKSNVFRVVSTGRTPSGLTATLVAVIDRGGDVPFILDWREMP